jgi:hypothetical protein
MKATALFAAMLVAISANTVRGQAADEVVSQQPTNAAVTNRVAVSAISLTNTALQVISRMRGVDPANVKLRVAADRPTGPFEIDITSATDCKKEAEELSKELGSAAVIIFEHVSGDGVTRTNWSYRNGVGRQVTAPVGATGLGPSARRMYVWPQSQLKSTAPAGVRVRTKIDD